MYKPSANGWGGGVDSCGRLVPRLGLPPFLLCPDNNFHLHSHYDDDYQDRVVVGVSRMGDGGKRSTTSFTGSHLDSRNGWEVMKW